MFETVVILAGGKGTRMWPLTDEMPKPMLPVAGKPVLAHIVDSIKAKKMFMVVGHKKEAIIGYFSTDRRITFIEQKEQLGTGHALMQLKGKIKGNFLLVNGDEIKGPLSAMPAKGFAIAAFESATPQNYGVLEVNNGLLAGLEEKPLLPKSRLVNIGAYSLTDKIFGVMEKEGLSKRGEYELTAAIQTLVDNGEKFKVVKMKYWNDVSYPWNLLDVNEVMMKDVKGKKAMGATVEKNVTMKGAVAVGKGTLIKSGAYIEGPVVIGENCVIGPNCYLRGATTIGNNCYVGNAVEIKNSIVMDNTHIGHLSYVGDSVIGRRCNFGAGTICANLKFDDKTVWCKVNGNFIDTKLRKLGTIMGDNVKTGINTSIMPGVMVGAGSWLMSGATIYRDVPTNTREMKPRTEM